MKLNLNKLEELAKQGVVESVWSIDNSGVQQSIGLLTIQDIKIDANHSISLQLGYNYSKLCAMNVVCGIHNHTSENCYSITLPFGNLSDALEMLGWDYSFSKPNTANLFNQLMLSSKKMERPSGHDQDLKSGPVGLFEHHETKGIRYHVAGTDISEQKGFDTIEEVSQEVQKNYVKNVINRKDKFEELSF